MKRCSRCRKPKEPDDFHWKVKGLYRQSRCKLCVIRYNKAWYAENKTAILARLGVQKRKARASVAAKLRELRSAPCTDCKKKYGYWVMQFDHFRGQKSFDISRGAAFGYAWATMEEELAKCELVCANCHATRTHRRKEAALTIAK